MRKERSIYFLSALILQSGSWWCCWDSQLSWVEGRVPPWTRKRHHFTIKSFGVKPWVMQVMEEINSWALLFCVWIFFYFIWPNKIKDHRITQFFCVTFFSHCLCQCFLSKAFWCIAGQYCASYCSRNLRSTSYIQQFSFFPELSGLLLVDTSTKIIFLMLQGVEGPGCALPLQPKCSSLGQLVRVHDQSKATVQDRQFVWSQIWYLGHFSCVATERWLVLSLHSGKI